MKTEDTDATEATGDQPGEQRAKVLDFRLPEVPIVQLKFNISLRTRNELFDLGDGKKSLRDQMLAVWQYGMTILRAFHIGNRVVLFKPDGTFVGELPRPTEPSDDPSPREQ